ncbi:choice-of-anchor I family protein [Pedobacter sandarakinus]|uniref:choice-of-anchor I family protein n=1 Tax=Pedobacter sandarakinus TaxID=353156 RepID=UPI002247197C|nr:choice-of-anchor I family protein [Pedobacter sandarakinus]MCX2575993.1 choice-of-anchor I family protein [Pedobacter sandarakinus]
MNRKKLFVALFSATLAFAACKKNAEPINEPTKEPIVAEDIASFKEIASIDLGGETSAEISAYDPLTKKLFVVSNEGGAKVEVVDLSNYPTVTKLKTLSYPANAGINSVAVSNGLLAVALDGADKQGNGDVVVLKTSDLSEVKKIVVGAMPDMVTFSPDGNYILSANEGEPNDAYTVDPSGTISIINIKDNYAVKTLDFAAFESQKTALVNGGFHIYGLNASFAQDIEPEYIAISNDSKKAYVTLQENNGVAEVDITAGTITKIIPLGTRDISNAENAFDVSDKDNKIALGTWPIKAFYLPDAISYFSTGGTAYLALANEGDTRAWKGYDEEVRVKGLKLDPTKFPTASTLQLDANLGRLTITKAFGDTDGDGDYDELYATGGRSLSILNASTGALVANIGKDLEQQVINAGKYDDERSDNKGVEVEGVTVAEVNGKTLAFIGMERVDMIAVYDISIPTSPKFVQLFSTGDAPEGVLFIKPKDSPNGRSLLVVASEGDGTVKFFQPNRI